jgi:hypothetical protein
MKVEDLKRINHIHSQPYLSLCDGGSDYDDCRECTELSAQYFFSLSLSPAMWTDTRDSAFS